MEDVLCTTVRMSGISDFGATDPGSELEIRHDLKRTTGPFDKSNMRTVHRNGKQYAAVYSMYNEDDMKLYSLVYYRYRQNPITTAPKRISGSCLGCSRGRCRAVRAPTVAWVGSAGWANETQIRMEA